MRRAGIAQASAVLALLSPPRLLRGTEPAAPVEVSAPPGGLARWSSPGLESCGLGERSWAPNAGVCWYPIDLLSPQGTRLEVRRRRDGHDETAVVVVGRYPYPEQRLKVKEKHVHLSKRDLERTRREAQRVAPLWAREGGPGVVLPLAAPLTRLPPGGRFGTRRFFNGEARSPHSGVDYAAPTGTPVLAAAGGVVALAEEHFFSGGSVFVDHGGGLITLYFHLSRIEVAAGETVAAGQRLGRVGATGRATGPHLHFAARLHGARVNPELLLRPAEAVAIGE